MKITARCEFFGSEDDYRDQILLLADKQPVFRFYFKWPDESGNADFQVISLVKMDSPVLLGIPGVASHFELLSWVHNKLDEMASAAEYIFFSELFEDAGSEITLLEKE